MRRILAATTALAGTAIGIYAAESYVVQRLAWNPDPTALADFSRPRGNNETVICADGTRLSTVSLGSGPTILLAHGYTGNLLNWSLIAPQLVESGFRVVMFDQRGHGESTVGSDGFGIAQLGADLAAVLEQLDLTNVTAVGHSMGGIGLQSFLLDHGDIAAQRVDNVVFLSTLCRGIGVSTSSLLALKFLRTKLFKRVRASNLHGLFMTARAFGSSPALSQVEAAMEASRDCSVDTMHDALIPLLEFDLTSQLHGISQPSIVVCGTRDNVTLPRGSQELAIALDADLYWLEGAGHITPYERYKEVAELIISQTPD